MYDVNPLGPMMHLKELERQAALKLRPLQSKEQWRFTLAAVSTAVIAVRRRFHAVRILSRTARDVATRTHLPESP